MPHRLPDPVKHCEICGDLMTRKRYPGGDLETMAIFLVRRRCYQSCANSKLEVTKDTQHWRARKHRKTACEECGTSLDLHVHHADRDHTNNDPENLITLCSSCHLKLHWREDREKRMAGVRKGQATVVARYGANTRPRSTDGRWRSAG